MATIIKGFRAVVLLSVVSLISVLPLIFSRDYFNREKIDVYLFSDHVRWAENIAYDISQMVTIITLTYTIWFLIPERKYKRYAMSFLIISLLSIPGYFLFYSQLVSLVFIPLLIILLYSSYVKNGDEKRNNIR